MSLMAVEYHRYVVVYWSRDKLMKRRPNSVCAQCSKRIYRRPLEIASGNVYCSLKCCGLGQRKEHVCRICGSRYIGAKKTCSRACANTARKGVKYTGLNPSNRATRSNLLKEMIAKARGGTCEKCAEKNYAILQVHHKLERHRGGDDNVSNLILLCPNCHATHHLGTSLWPLIKNDRVQRQKKSRRSRIVV